MPHAALCVLGPEMSTPDVNSLPSFNAARSIVCVGTLCPAALVPRGLRRHFGKTRFFAPFLASADELCPEKRGIHRRCPLCGAGCTVLERRNGGMRLCARAGALSISFSSYLKIAHASFFFNDALRRCREVGKKYIVPIEILFYMCYSTSVINEITKYKSNGGIDDENCSCCIQWKGEPCDY